MKNFLLLSACCLFILINSNSQSISSNGDCGFNTSVITPPNGICSDSISDWIHVAFPNLYSYIEWSVLNNNGSIISVTEDSDSALVIVGTYQVTTVDINGCQRIRNLVVQNNTVFFPPIVPTICNSNQVIWNGQAQSTYCKAHVIHLKLLDGNEWNNGQIEVISSGLPEVHSLSSQSNHQLIDIAVFNFDPEVEYIYHSDNGSDQIIAEIIDLDNNLLFSDTIGTGSFFLTTHNCQNLYSGQLYSSCGIIETETTNQSNIHTLTVAENFLGTCQVMFESDICGSYNIDLTFSQTPESILIDTFACSPPLYLELAQKQNLDYNYNWIPNFCGNNSGCEVNESGTYIIIASNECGSATSTATVTFSDDSGEVLTSEGLDHETIYLNNPETFIVEFSNTSNTTLPYQYIISDENNMVISVQEANYDFSSLPPGIYHVWGIIEQNSVEIIPGIDLFSIPIIDCPVLTEDFLEVTVDLIDNIFENSSETEFFYFTPISNSVHFSVSNSNYQIKIYSSIGQLLHISSLPINNMEFQLPTLNKGIYIIELKGTDFSRSIKIV